MAYKIEWTPEYLNSVQLPKGAAAEDVCAKANELFQQRAAYITCLARRFPKTAARLPSDVEYSRALLEHIEDYGFYLVRRSGFLQDVLKFDASFRGADISTSYGRPVNRDEIAEYLNWQMQRILPEFQDVMDANIAVMTSFSLNDEIMEMPWCPWPGEPMRI